MPGILTAPTMLSLNGDGLARNVAGRFRLVSELGQGGTANVYLAIADGPSGFHKLVVLKVLKKSLCDDEEFRAMFLSEARLAARLAHPNIVQTYDVLECGGLPTLVMEYLEGEALSQIIMRGAGGGFTLPSYLRVLADALRGLHAAHELRDFDGAPLGVVHRDVSPQNLFVTVDGQAKVLDFGIAKLVEDRAAVETTVGTIKGKLRYMAPEQLVGGPLDRRADIYAAGVMLWEALTGRRMWKGADEHEIRSRVLAGDLPALDVSPPHSGGGADVRDELARICSRALSLRAADRFATAAELAERLEATLPQLGPLVTRPEIGAAVARLFQDQRDETRAAIENAMANLSAPARAAVLAGGGVLRGPGHPPPRTRRVALAVAGVLAVSLLAGGAWTTWVRSPGGHVAQPSPAAPKPSSAAEMAQARPRADRRSTTGVDRDDDAPQPRPASGQQPTDLPAPPPPPVAPMVRGGSRSPAAHSVIAGHSRRPRQARVAPPLPPTTAQLSPPSPDAAPRTGHDCDHPFFVDADGIKKFRPECM